MNQQRYKIQRKKMSGTDDLASLPDLNEEIILEKLKKRYQNDAIYVI